MARIRSIHPGQWTDDQFVTCSAMARLVAIGLRNEADDNGIFEWNPIKLKMRLLPADNCDMAELLDELLQTEQVIRYEVSGKQYGAIRNWHKYQHPKKPTYQYPVPNFDCGNGYEFGTSGELVGNQWGSSSPDVEKRREEKRRY